MVAPIMFSVENTDHDTNVAAIQAIKHMHIGILLSLTIPLSFLIPKTSIKRMAMDSTAVMSGIQFAYPIGIILKYEH